MTDLISRLRNPDFGRFCGDGAQDERRTLNEAADEIERLSRVAITIPGGLSDVCSENIAGLIRGIEERCAAVPGTGNALAAARKFCEEYRKEWQSSQSIAENWPGWSNGFEVDDAVDTAFLALEAALAQSSPAAGDSKTFAGETENPNFCRRCGFHRMQHYVPIDPPALTCPKAENGVGTAET